MGHDWVNCRSLVLGLDETVPHPVDVLIEGGFGR
jgi:hypothetical protein